jgi:hypothetical protein
MEIDHFFGNLKAAEQRARPVRYGHLGKGRFTPTTGAVCPQRTQPVSAITGHNNVFCDGEGDGFSE